MFNDAADEREASDTGESRPGSGSLSGNATAAQPAAAAATLVRTAACRSSVCSWPSRA